MTSGSHRLHSAKCRTGELAGPASENKNIIKSIEILSSLSHLQVYPEALMSIKHLALVSLLCLLRENLLQPVLMVFGAANPELPTALEQNVGAEEIPVFFVQREHTAS